MTMYNKVLAGGDGDGDGGVYGRGMVKGMEDCWLVPGQHRLQHRLEPCCRCRMLMGGGTEPRVRASSAAPDPGFKSFLRYEDLMRKPQLQDYK